VSDALGRKEGMLAAYQLNPATGRLSYINNQGTLGSVPAYTSFDCAGKFLLGANYSMDTEPPDSSPDQAIAVMPIRTDGGVGAPVASRARMWQGIEHAALCDQSTIRMRGNVKQNCAAPAGQNCS
jgi:6-phosphogluconolactonase (cycloisomerase 2 family)